MSVPIPITKIYCSWQDVGVTLLKLRSYRHEQRRTYLFQVSAAPFAACLLKDITFFPIPFMICSLSPCISLILYCIYASVLSSQWSEPPVVLQMTAAPLWPAGTTSLLSSPFFSSYLLSSAQAFSSLSLFQKGHLISFLFSSLLFSLLFSFLFFSSLLCLTSLCLRRIGRGRNLLSLP